MKTRVPYYARLACLLTLLCAAAGLPVRAQTSLNLSFTNPSLYSGTAGQDNAVYKFASVNSDLDAYVKITGRSSAQVKLVNIDITSTGFARAFQPQVSYGNGNVNSANSWWMEFEVSFVNKNTLTPATINTFSVTALDIDGDGNNLREWDAFYGLASYTLENNSLLQVTSITQTIQNVLQTVGKTFTGTLSQYNGIDTTATKIMTTVNYNNVSTFRFRTGATTTGPASTSRMYSTWFRDFTYSAPVITSLPVKLESFTATLNINKADLKWVTASEINVSHFVVEKSLDGKTYNDAGVVFAYGNSSSKATYYFTDNLANIQSGVVYYRLRSVDNDGKYQLSENRIIRISKLGDSPRLVIYPNPVTSELRVTVPSSWQNREVLYEIFNQAGQRMRAMTNRSASQTETFQVSDLQKGFYIVRATCGSDNAQEKLVKY